MMGRGWKVFLFGIKQELIGTWLTAHKEPGFHIWSMRESAERYAIGAQGCEIRQVMYRGAINRHLEPQGPALTATEMLVL